VAEAKKYLAAHPSTSGGPGGSAGIVLRSHVREEPQTSGGGLAPSQSHGRPTKSGASARPAKSGMSLRSSKNAPAGDEAQSKATKRVP
jgi:hypothetical protein